MNLTRTRRTEQPADPADSPQPDVEHLQELARTLIPPVDRHDEAERAAHCAEQAEALRESVAGTVEAAQADLAEAEAEAARTVNAARSRMADIRAHALGVEREAAAAEDKGNAYRHAANLAAQAREAFADAQRLAAERQDQLVTADALSARLAELDGLRLAAQADLEAARADTDADAAGEARTRLTGLDEVTPVLAGQRDAALARAREIGTEDSGGQYAQILGRVAALVAEREKALDQAEPERIEARRASNPLKALLDDLGKLTPAAREQVLASWTGATQPATATQLRRTPDGRVTGDVRTTR